VFGFGAGQQRQQQQRQQQQQQQRRQQQQQRTSERPRGTGDARDPGGFYNRLGVGPGCSKDEIQVRHSDSTVDARGQLLPPCWSDILLNPWRQSPSCRHRKAATCKSTDCTARHMCNGGGIVCRRHSGGRRRSGTRTTWTIQPRGRRRTSSFASSWRPTRCCGTRRSGGSMTAASGRAAAAAAAARIDRSSGPARTRAGTTRWAPRALLHAHFAQASWQHLDTFECDCSVCRSAGRTGLCNVSHVMYWAALQNGAADRHIASWYRKV